MDEPSESDEKPVVLNGDGLSFSDVLAVARRDRWAQLSPAAVERLNQVRAIVDRMADADEPAYGISTGFGALAQTKIPPDQRRQLQTALVRSHAAGMGPHIERDVVRAMMLLRARTLAMGYSGVRPVVAEQLLALLNSGITPLVPEHGSLGASGDLAPLAHAALCLIGEGEVVDADGAVRPADEVLPRSGIEPLTLETKEGLALLNGTDGMLGMLVLACHDAEQLLKVADVTAAMSVEALLGTDRVFQPEIHELRPQIGQSASAANLALLLQGSEIVASHRYGDARVQDAYSMRCTPQVLGAARDTLGFATQIAQRELASCTDNPVVLAGGLVESNGNFHGAPLGYACDFLAIALTDVASLAERRIDRLLDATRSAGLPPFLAPEAGVNSGLMIAQYTAAALLAECRQLAYPASVDTVPTSGMQEDHVSMGWTAARKLRQVVANATEVIAIELVCASAGLDFREPMRPAVGTGAARDVLRRAVAPPGPDRVVAPDLQAAAHLVSSGTVLDQVVGAIGPLS